MVSNYHHILDKNRNFLLTLLLPPKFNKFKQFFCIPILKVDITPRINAPLDFLTCKFFVCPPDILLLEVLLKPWAADYTLTCRFNNFIYFILGFEPMGSPCSTEHSFPFSSKPVGRVWEKRRWCYHNLSPAYKGFNNFLCFTKKFAYYVKIRIIWRSIVNKISIKFIGLTKD